MILPIVKNSVTYEFIKIGIIYAKSVDRIIDDGNYDYERLYRPDFAGEKLDKYSNLKLIENGFAYHRDAAFPQDDITWFLMQKS
jgi:hypothetical protein